MDTGFERFGITPDDYECFSRFIDRVSSEILAEAEVRGVSASPEMREDLSQNMWLTCLTKLDNPPRTMPTEGIPRNKYLMTAMAREARRFKLFDSPYSQKHRPQYERMTEHEEE